MISNKSALLGLLHRIAYAALVSCVVWIATWDYPAAGELTVTSFHRVAIWLDLPIALATQVVPCDEFAVDLWFTVQGGEPCPINATPREQLLNHMRLGIPVYALIFYLPNLALLLYRRFSIAQEFRSMGKSPDAKEC